MQDEKYRRMTSSLKVLKVLYPAYADTIQQSQSFLDGLRAIERLERKPDEPILKTDILKPLILQKIGQDRIWRKIFYE